MTFSYWIHHTFGRSNFKTRKLGDFPPGRTCRRCKPMKCRTFKVQPQRSNLLDIQKPGHHSIANYFRFLMMYQKFVRLFPNRKCAPFPSKPKIRKNLKIHGRLPAPCGRMVPETHSKPCRNSFLQHSFGFE